MTPHPQLDYSDIQPLDPWHARCTFLLFFMGEDRPKWIIWHGTWSMAGVEELFEAMVVSGCLLFLSIESAKCFFLSCYMLLHHVTSIKLAWWCPKKVAAYIPILPNDKPINSTFGWFKQPELCVADLTTSWTRGLPAKASGPSIWKPSWEGHLGKRVSI